LMGTNIRRTEPRTIVVEGVAELKPADYTIMYDRNEAVTFACAALATKGDISVLHAEEKNLRAFLTMLKKINGGFEITKRGIHFFYKGELKAADIATQPYPGFMTDWMAVWSVLMTQARGDSIVHETIFENRFAFVEELKKMKAKIELFNPKIGSPEEVYNFNLEDDRPEYFHAAKISGPTELKATAQEITDVRAGASLMLASLIAKGESELIGVEHVDRGYENLDGRLKSLGADIRRKKT